MGREKGSKSSAEEMMPEGNANTPRREKLTRKRPRENSPRRMVKHLTERGSNISHPGVGLTCQSLCVACPYAERLTLRTPRRETRGFDADRVIGLQVCIMLLLSSQSTIQLRTIASMVTGYPSQQQGIPSFREEKRDDETGPRQAAHAQWRGRDKRQEKDQGRGDILNRKESKAKQDKQVGDSDIGWQQ